MWVSTTIGETEREREREQEARVAGGGGAMTWSRGSIRRPRSWIVLTTSSEVVVYNYLKNQLFICFIKNIVDQPNKTKDTCSLTKGTIESCEEEEECRSS